MVSRTLSDPGSRPLNSTVCAVEGRFPFRKHAFPSIANTRAQSKRFDCASNILTPGDFLVRNLSHGIHLRFTIMIDGCSP
jgi:hypothetical protein